MFFEKSSNFVAEITRMSNNITEFNSFKVSHTSQFFNRNGMSRLIVQSSKGLEFLDMNSLDYAKKFKDFSLTNDLLILDSTVINLIDYKISFIRNILVLLIDYTKIFVCRMEDFLSTVVRNSCKQILAAD